MLSKKIVYLGKEEVTVAHEVTFNAKHPPENGEIIQVTMATFTTAAGHSGIMFVSPDKVFEPTWCVKEKASVPTAWRAMNIIRRIPRIAFHPEFKEWIEAAFYAATVNSSSKMPAMAAEKIKAVIGEDAYERIMSTSIPEDVFLAEYERPGTTMVWNNRLTMQW